MSLSDTSIEERSIIKALAANSNFSAVEFFPAGSRFAGTPVFNCDAIIRLSLNPRADKPKLDPHSRVN